MSSNLNETPTYDAEIPQEVVTVSTKRKMSVSLPSSKRIHGFHTHQVEGNKAILKNTSSINEIFKNLDTESLDHEVSLYCRSLTSIILPCH